jgi:hypothetical protein
MKERIESMIRTLGSGVYDPEITHQEYDSLLTDFILQDCSIRDFPEMRLLIAMPCNFWYA